MRRKEIGVFENIYIGGTNTCVMMKRCAYKHYVQTDKNKFLFFLSGVWDKKALQDVMGREMPKRSLGFAHIHEEGLVWFLATLNNVQAQCQHPLLSEQSDEVLGHDNHSHHNDYRYTAMHCAQWMIHQSWTGRKSLWFRSSGSSDGFSYGVLPFWWRSAFESCSLFGFVNCCCEIFEWQYILTNVACWSCSFLNDPHGKLVRLMITGIYKTQTCISNNTYLYSILFIVIGFFVSDLPAI